MIQTLVFDTENRIGDRQFICLIYLCITSSLQGLANQGAWKIRTVAVRRVQANLLCIIPILVYVMPKIPIKPLIRRFLPLIDKTQNKSAEALNLQEL